MNFVLIFEVGTEWNFWIFEFKTFKMYVDFITNFRGDLKINFNFISEDSRS